MLRHSPAAPARCAGQTLRAAFGPGVPPGTPGGSIRTTGPASVRRGGFSPHKQRGAAAAASWAHSQPPSPHDAAPHPGASQASPDDREDSVPRFSWTQQWYPLAPLSYLPRDRPTATALLGRQLVVWFHGPTQSWRVMEDRCPHRLAPLSEGRIQPETGDLQCSYHGWTFGPSGACTHIPQADSPQQEEVACGSPRSCVAAFPVQEEQGLLWVWMESGPAVAATSLRRQLPLPTELRADPAASPPTSGILLGDWYQRDLPVSFDFLLENLLDPAHVHWAHHGVIGSRARGGPISLEHDGLLTPQGGFTLRMAGQWGQRALRAGAGRPKAGAQQPSQAGVPAVTHFVPPGLVWLEMPAGDSHFSMLFYAVPVGPGASRLIAGYSTDAVPQSLRAWLQPLGVLEPVLNAFQFLGDLGSHEVIDGDLVHIHQQELAARREGSWSKAYYMPAAADRGIVLLRRWLGEMAGGGPEYGPSAQTTDVRLTPTQPSMRPAGSTGRALSRREILDRYEQHTRQCPSCRRALGVVQATRQGLQLATASSFASAFALVLLQALLPAPAAALAPGGRLGAASLPLLLGIAGLAAGGLSQALQGLEQRFIFVDYVHADK